MSIYGTPNTSGSSAGSAVNNTVPRAPSTVGRPTVGLSSTGSGLAVGLSSTVSGATVARNSVARGASSSINVVNTSVDLTVRVFDNFNPLNIDVPVNEWDQVISFFNKVFGTGDSATAFATNMFRVANESDIPVLTLLDQMEQFDRIKVTQTLAYYLNGYRSLSTLLGVNSAVVPSVWAARNILP